jgi:hypothetical protein
MHKPVTCRECGWRWPFSENKPPPSGAVCLNCDGELERDLGVTAGSDEPTDPTLRVYQRPAADVAHRPGSGRGDPDGLTEDVFAGCAAVALPAQRTPPTGSSLVESAAREVVRAAGALLCDYGMEGGIWWDDFRAAVLELRKAFGLSEDLTDTEMLPAQVGSDA